MKPYQIGLLIAAAAFGGGLFVKYAGNSDAPAAAPVVATTPAPAAEMPAEPAPVASEPLPSAFVSEPKPVRRKPSPAPKPTPEQPQMAQNQSPAPAAPAPAPEPTPAPAPANILEAPKLEPPAPPPPRTLTVPAGTVIPVRLDYALGSDRNAEGDSFTATLESPLVVDGYVIAEKGARLDGQVVSSEKAGRVKGVSNLSLELKRLRTSDGQRIDIQTETFEKQGETSKKEDAAKVGAAAGIGAAIGAIAGGGKGAAIGAAIGGASGTGGVLATRGKPAVLPAETRISFRLRDAVTVTERR